MFRRDAALRERQTSTGPARRTAPSCSLRSRSSWEGNSATTLPLARCTAWPQRPPAAPRFVPCDVRPDCCCRRRSRHRRYSPSSRPARRRPSSRSNRVRATSRSCAWARATAVPRRRRAPCREASRRWARERRPGRRRPSPSIATATRPRTTTTCSISKTDPWSDRSIPPILRSPRRRRSA